MMNETTPRAYRLIRPIFFVALTLLVAYFLRTSQDVNVEQGAKTTSVCVMRPMMGTLVKVVVACDKSLEPQARTAISKAFSSMNECVLKLSTHDANSEVAKLSSIPVGKTAVVSDAVYQCLADGMLLSERSGGAFDMTLKPLVLLYKKSRAFNRLPTQGEVSAALSRTGYKNIKLDEENNSITMLKKDIALDLGAIAKGFVADVGLNALVENGFSNAMIEAGGDVVVKGTGLTGKGWRIGLQNPAHKNPLGVLLIDSNAVATSGDYENSFVIDKIRYSHIIDPRNGLPLTGKLRSVSAIAHNATTADGLATALSVLGYENSKELLAYYPSGGAIWVYEDEEKGFSVLISGVAKEVFTKWRPVEMKAVEVK